MEKGKEIENNWNNNQLNILINNCINIENNIRNIKLLNESIVKTNNLKIDINFLPKEDGVNQLLDSIKKFGEIIKTKFGTNIDFDEKLVETWLYNRKFEPIYYIENQEMVQLQMISIVGVIIKE